jgi:hypothetical protein
MPTDDEAARKARADRLHAQIESYKEKNASSDAAAPAPESEGEQTPAPTPPAESPRDFVHRRMRELKKKKKKDS